MQVPCLNSLAADRAYFAPDAGDMYESFVAGLSDDEFNEAANELAAEMFGDDCNEWPPAAWDAFKEFHADTITDRLWERA